MHSEAKSTPVRLPPGQRATVTTFDPHKPIFPSRKDTACASAADRILSANTWIKMGNQVVCECVSVSCTHQLTFFLEKGFSGGQGTLAYFWILQEFYRSGNLEGENVLSLPFNSYQLNTWRQMKKTRPVRKQCF